MSRVARSRDEGLERVRDLVSRFRERIDYYRSEDYDEASARSHFIDPLLQALGWDVADEQGLGPAREVVVENRVISAGEAAGQDEWDEELSMEELAERLPRASKPDYQFRLFRQTVFVAEAKKPSISLRKRAPAFQIKSYAWTLGTPIGLLTDFEEFRVFDATLRPEYERPEHGVIGDFDITWESYVDAWPRLWDTLSRPAVAAGSLKRLATANKRRARGAVRVDDHFLSQLEAWRERLAQAFYEANHALEAHELAEATQRVLDRVVFVRVCEDRQIEPNVVLRRFARTTDAYAKACREFRRLDAVYNGALFAPHWSERLQLPDEVFQQLVADLYFPAPYRFDVIGADVLGSVYERFLGREIEITDGAVKLAAKPETRHAGGVYYTPRWVVDHIVQQTLAPLLIDKTPRAAANLRIVDPACGSGAFLLGTLDYLIHWHEDYFTKNPTDLQERHYPSPDGTRRLTSDAKAQLLDQCIFGVDIDPQAVEVTQMSLYLKVLEGESRATLEQQHRLFHAPFLPLLKNNIRCGNSLLSAADVDQQLLFDPGLGRRINPFDWEDDALGFGKVLAERGGFDAVIGNPPYTRTQVLREYRPEETAAYAKKYRSAATGSFDIAAPFVEKGLSLLRARGGGGRLGFIVSRQLCEADFGAPLREMLAGGRHVESIVDFGSGLVFEGTGAYTMILVANAVAQPSWHLTRVSEEPSREALAEALASSTQTAAVKAEALHRSSWDLLLPDEEKLLDRLEEENRSLGEICGSTVFQGVVTGADYVFRLLIQGPAKEPGCTLIVRRDGDGEEAAPIENALLRPVLNGRGDVRRFRVEPSKEVLLLPYNRSSAADRYKLIPPKALQRSYPHAFQWLRKHRDELAGRSGKWTELNWYAFSRRQNLELFDAEKVLVPYMVEELCAHHDTGGHWFVNVSTGGYGIPTARLEDSDLLVALLSSRLLSWVLSRRSRAWRGGWFAARKGNLVRLPVAEPDESTGEEIKELFRRCCAAAAALDGARSDRETDRCQRLLGDAVRRFDTAAFDLYGLSRLERELVRGV